jgi:hypothetical protein
VLGAYLILVALVGAVLINLLAPTPGTAVLVVVIAGLWLPVNNGHLEGPILIEVDPRHGLSTADLASYAAFVLANLSLWRWRSVSRSARRTAAVIWAILLACLLVGALAIDWVDQ